MRTTRGMFGKQVVFKKRGGKYYVSAPPETDENRVPTAGQRAVRDRFRRNSVYATAAIQDEGTRALYAAAARRNQSAHNVAFRDASNAPEVLEIEAGGYEGAIGNRIVVEAIDDFTVSVVKVAVYNPSGVLVESGEAVPSAQGLHWTYTATQANASVSGSRIVATAVDLPGNEGLLEITL